MSANIREKLNIKRDITKMKSKSKKIFLGFFLFTLLGLYANASAKVDSSKANSPKVAKIADDKANIYALVDRIAEPHGFSTTIKTIIYLESRNGLYPINLNDPACGITHINLNTYMRRHKLKDTPFNRNKACADLINSQEWAILNALQELLFLAKSALCFRRLHHSTIQKCSEILQYRMELQRQKSKRVLE